MHIIFIRDTFSYYKYVYLELFQKSRNNYFILLHNFYLHILQLIFLI